MLDIRSFVSHLVLSHLVGDSAAKQWSLGSNLPQLSATEVVDTLSKWEGVEETITLFDDMIKAEQSK